MDEQTKLEELRRMLTDGRLVNEDGTPSDADTADRIDTEPDTEPDEAAIAEFLADFESGPAKEYRITVPHALCDHPHDCRLYGVAREETGIYYIIETATDEDAPVPSQWKPIGYVTLDGSVPSDCEAENAVVGRLSEDGRLCFSVQGVPLRVETYDTVTKLFSRNTGLLESSWMLGKWAVIVGCGSVGSLVAMALARSGVGHFVLIDTDKLEMHNICRHQCGFDDLGRFKVDAVRDKVTNINPWAEVVTYTSILQDILEEELLPYLGRDTVILGCGDNRGSSNWACKLAIRTGSAFLTTGCWTRAYAGEVFYWLPGRDMPCYDCALGKISSTDRPESHATYFGEEEDMHNLSFEPGVSVDIDFVTTVALKLTLDIINRDNENYTPRVINYLTQYTLVCNTNEPRVGGKMAKIFSYPLQVTHNLYFRKKEGCPFCSGQTADGA